MKASIEATIYPDWLIQPIIGTNVVSFSGGRTSAFLVYLMEQKRLAGADVHYVFMDTGAEHPKTYEFVRNVAREWGIPLVCIRAEINPQQGIGVRHRVVSIDEIGQDLVPWRDMLRKYGAPDAARPHCTNKMKQRPYDDFIKAEFGAGITTWIGIRDDEPRRLTPKPGIRYLAELTDADKQEILDWWSYQPFDLGIDEHLGNCVFCVKKSDGKLNLAARDEREAFERFVALVEGDEVRTEGLKNPELSKKMYRGHRTLSDIATLFPDESRDELFKRLKMSRALDKGQCSESCEVF